MNKTICAIVILVFAMLFGFYKLMVYTQKIAYEFDNKCEINGGTVSLHDRFKQEPIRYCIKNNIVIDIQY